MPLRADLLVPPPPSGALLTLDALYVARAAHLEHVAHLAVADAVRVLAAAYEIRTERAGYGDLGRRRVTWLEETVVPAEARDMLAWYLAEGDVGLAPRD